MAAMRLALARKTHRAAACLTAAIACCAACVCAGCTGAATHPAGAMLPVSGSPFGVAATADGRWAFVAVGGPRAGSPSIDVLRLAASRAAARRAARSRWRPPPTGGSRS